LHQLAFDGHWHELARVGLNDAALREKMANMREIAQRLEGRRFKVRVWLPADQIVLKASEISAQEPRAIETQARQVLEKTTPHSGGDFAVAVSPPNDGDQTWVAGARVKTMFEAFAFAKSHGFNATVYSTKDQVEGFAEKPYFRLPPNRVKTIGLGVAALTLAGSLVAAGVAFRIADPYLWWETPPVVADFAPFQTPDPSINKSQDNILPITLAGPVFNAITPISTLTLRDPLPYLPARQLDATAQDFIEQPIARFSETFDVSFSIMNENLRFSLPLELEAIAPPSAADRPPAIGLYNLLTEITPFLQPDIAPDTPDIFVSKTIDQTKNAVAPITVASIRFVLEPLPALATTISYSLQRELADSFGITLQDLPAELPTVLAETQVVRVIRGLPELLPKLRSGAEIPPQVAVLELQPVVTIIETIPADPEAIATAARGFAIIQGRPEIVPVRRAIPPPPVDPVVAEIAPEPELETPAETGDQTAEIEIAAAGQAVDLPEFTGTIAVVAGRPDLLPILRSGDAIPDPLPAEEQPQETVEIAAIDPAVALANSLRAKRRPAAIANIPAPVDPMLSDAAPALAVVPAHRNASSAANAARIIELASNRPRAVAPVVPADPQTVNLPTRASVARAATIDNGINLRKTSLIGIFGTADHRNVLIRMSGGRMLQLSMGDTFSGWRVVAIGADSVRIQKGNRTEILRMPN
ncbi:MAG: hypothetical protein L3J33_10935, partial [Rhodobacteraceae bacterium]|nr:hypothetical protein [Paracoccaceae bacterium]